MTDDEFWRLIGASAGFNGQDEQLAALRRALRAVPAQRVLEFETAFHRNMARAYTWDLWGAGYVIHGGMSDDGFEYFRRWVIGQGRAVFDQATAQPDSLADIIPASADSALEFELLAYVAGEVWVEKTGADVDAFYERVPFTAPGGTPHGEPFSEDLEVLARRYPRLWRRFGAQPLE